MPLTLQHLLTERPKLEVARPDGAVAAAMERMIELDYSQLPVVEDHPLGGLRPVGLISMHSIARAAQHLGLRPEVMRVLHATDPRPVTAAPTDELWPVLHRMRDGQALLVVDAERRLLGILTGSDLADYLLDRTDDGFALQEVEATLKDLIRRRFEEDDEGLRQAVIQLETGEQRGRLLTSVRRLVAGYLSADGGTTPKLDAERVATLFERHIVQNVTGELDRLTFNQYIELFLQACWPAHEPRFKLQATAMRPLLEAMREYRNRLAHHRGALTSLERDQLTYCRELLHRVADTGPVERPRAETPAEPAPPPEPAPAPQQESSPAPAASEAVPVGALLRLVELLEEQGSTEDRVTVEFSSIEAAETPEQARTRRLPTEARELRGWWSNNLEENPNAFLWMNPGWRVVNVNLQRETVTLGRNDDLNEAYIAAFSGIFAALAREPRWPEKVPSPAGRSWQPAAYLDTAGSARLLLTFASHALFRVELYLDTGDGSRNKAIFDAIRARAGELEGAAGVPLTWERLDDRRACRIAAYFPGKISVRSDEEALGRLQAWVAQVAPGFFEGLRRIYSTLHQPSPSGGPA